MTATEHIDAYLAARPSISPPFDIPTLHRWYRPSLYPRTNHVALVMAGATRPEARL